MLMKLDCQMNLPRSLSRRVALSLALVATLAAGSAAAEDLLQIYREAQKSDPQIAAARAFWEATQERVPQARSGLLPSVSATGAVNYNNYDFNVPSDNTLDFNRNYYQYSLTLSAPQPLYRYQNVV